MADKSTSLLRVVQERAILKKEAEEEKKKQQENLIPYLPRDCISNILVRLPLESLQRSRLVCKPWYKTVNSPIFIDAHLSRSENVLIFLNKLTKETFHPFSTASIPQEKPNTFSIEARLFQLDAVPIFQQPLLDQRSKYQIQFMEIRDGKSKMGCFNATCLGQIRASCNGLILLENKLKKGRLVVLNPVTRKLISLPLGTLYEPHDESYGLVLCNYTSKYKLVHLFRDEMQYIGCEILIIGARSWKVVDGPSFGLFSWFGYNPISAIGALHWVPHVDRSEYIVSMTVDDEKFHKKWLPKISRTGDAIVEMGGLLCFVSHEGADRIDLWVLRSLCGEEWAKQYSITVGCMMYMVPLCCSRISGEMIFQSSKDSSLYAYDFQFEDMKTVETEEGCIPLNDCYLPHVNSLVSW
ncbi:hypothetical protein Acr_18g0001680 [Actinidia rufa]|uniref:F-box domain-containing protein n=1 Tax=Actinidia rufa TaxID=165716 RepID=A0A7J0G5C6_9ERIC|nr:hypothetical protein Acr_18g0001680 [Actinidia rufa]